MNELSEVRGISPCIFAEMIDGLLPSSPSLSYTYDDVSRLSNPDNRKAGASHTLSGLELTFEFYDAVAMSEHKATLQWQRATPDFTYQTYNRDHTWSFKDGMQIDASAAPAYLGNPALVDPEDAYVASLASCHMLTFLAVACKKRFAVESYRDAAVGFMEKNAEGKLAITRVVLRPEVTFSGENQPTAEQLGQLHHTAHSECFIANSVKTDVTVEPSDGK
jgi:organic hydroperoxide reductase OsmC/OhrA